MAKKPQSATAPDQSPASAESSAAQAEGQATENSPPPPDAKTPPKPERKSFVAVFNVVDGAKTYKPGETAMLTRAQFGELKPLGAIEGDWE